MFSIEFLSELRDAELDSIIAELKPGAHVLEFGAGTGIQAKRLSERGYRVTAVDLPSSGYAEARVFPVIDYDGLRLPLPDDSVDVIYSSNVLEHVEQFERVASEFRRVTRPGGYGVHLMPSPSWRAWTFASGLLNTIPAAGAVLRDLVSPPEEQSRVRRTHQNLRILAGCVLPIGHGTSVEGISELWTFSARSWRRRFEANGFVVDQIRPVGIFHTGHQVLGRRIEIERRRVFARKLGSAANLFVVRNAEEQTGPGRSRWRGLARQRSPVAP